MTDVATRGVADVLRAHGERTAAALAAYLPVTEPRRHLYDLVRDYPERGGKAIRPALCLATCAAFGGDEDDALASAVAIELFHNAFLVHDDVEDGSELRRGAGTLHAQHGAPLAINAGDALAVLAHAPLHDNRSRLGTRLAARVAAEFDTMLRRTVEGQAIELGWRRDGVVDVTPDDYLDLILRKTCWYTTIHPMRVGALIGSWGQADLDPFVRFGFYLGAAFQIQDDLLNLEGDVVRYGKELRGDLFEGKRTLMVIHLLRALEGAERAHLVRFLAGERSSRSARDVAHVHDLMRAHGSIDFAREFGRGIAAAAHDAFEAAFAAAPDTPHRRFVRDLIDWMLTRTA